jgi:hypothetical protein
MKPEDVKHGKFKLVEVLFNNGEYTIASGIWEGVNKILAERWNGDGNDPGWPRQGKYPTWMVVHDELKETRVKSLLGLQGANNPAVLKILREIYKGS